MHAREALKIFEHRAPMQAALGQYAEHPGGSGCRGTLCPPGPAYLWREYFQIYAHHQQNVGQDRRPLVPVTIVAADFNGLLSDAEEPNRSNRRTPRRSSSQGQSALEVRPDDILQERSGGRRFGPPFSRSLSVVRGH
jgi:hypothetical protein